MLTPEQIVEKIPALTHREELPQDSFLVPREELIASIQSLKDELHYKALLDLTLVEFPEEILGVYNLMNLESMHMLNIEVSVPLDDLKLPSLTELYSAANHLEREAWEMFGVVYEGHPNLKRLLLPQDFVGFPLRKDYKHRSRV